LSAREEIRERKGRRLDSWKAIAQYLDRDVRSVQRWEQERGLPVHRVPGEKGGTVFAYEDELDRWLTGRDTPSAAASAVPETERSQPGISASAPPSQVWHWSLIALVIAMLVLVATLFVFQQPRVTKTAISLPQSPSIAVLPMINLSGDAAQDYFADGFTEELVTELAQIRALRVISRTSTMIYKGSRKSLPQIARELHVRYVLEGSVARVGQRVRVIAQLINAISDTHVSARTYDSNVKDVFDIQSRISRAIADDVRLDLTPDERARFASAREIDPEAHDLYLKASYQYARQTQESLLQSLALYRAAAVKAPSFAAAYVGIAQAEFALMTITAESPEEGAPRIREALAKALAIDPHLGEAHGLLAVLTYWWAWDWPKAEREYRLALAEGAQSPTERHFGIDLVTRDLFAEGMAHLQRAVELDPLGVLPRMSMFFGYYFQRNYGSARHVLDDVLGQHPDFLAGRALRGLVAMMQHDCTSTEGEADWTEKHFPSPLADFESALGAICRGDVSSARGSLEKMARSKGSPYVTQYQLALGYAAIGDRDTALSYVERSVDAHEGQATYLKVEPLFAALRSNPRFVAQERRVGLLP
jgi:TolB-like protein/Tfp pilus assembly protein PilF